MHYIAEIVIPPEWDVTAAVTQVMDSFRSEPDEEDGDLGEADWWDFWIIGGRFSGHKVQSSLDKSRLEEFNKELNRRNVTVSGFTSGKQELSPATQIPMVDALWREWFPGAGDKCILFKHSNDQYRKDGYYAEDVCTIDKLPDRLECERLIVAGPHWNDASKLMAKRHLAAKFWNGVEHQKTDFDGKVKPALMAMLAELEKPPDQQCYSARGLSLSPAHKVVTVDYHN